MLNWEVGIPIDGDKFGTKKFESTDHSKLDWDALFKQLDAIEWE